MIIGNIVFIYKYCFLCKKKRLLWGKSEKKYVINITKGTNYCCLKCVYKQKKTYKNESKRQGTRYNT
jgi:hypothetical protein